MTTLDQTLATEIALSLANEFTFYQKAKEYAGACAKHLKRGRYDSAKALAGFTRLVQSHGLPLYRREYHSTLGRVDAQTRQAIASRLWNDFEMTELISQ